MIALQGSAVLYQWDINRRVTVGVDACASVHFAHSNSAVALVVAVETAQDGTKSAAIPNQLLRQAGKLTAWACGTNGCTVDEATFKVRERAKPTNWTATETEVESYYEVKAWFLEKSAADTTRVIAAEEAAKAAQKAAADAAIGGGESALGHGLKRDEVGRIAVDMAADIETDNTLPVSSAAVAVTVGNIGALLATI